MGIVSLIIFAVSVAITAWLISIWWKSELSSWIKHEPTKRGSVHPRHDDGGPWHRANTRYQDYLDGPEAKKEEPEIERVW
mgnify:CR=1 FL=1